MSDEETHVLLHGDMEAETCTKRKGSPVGDGEGKSKKKQTTQQASARIKPIELDNEDEDEDEEEQTSRRKKGGKDKDKKKRKKKKSGKKKDDPSDESSTAEAKAALLAIIAEINDHKAEIARLEKQLAETALAHGIDLDDVIKESDKTEKVKSLRHVTGRGDEDVEDVEAEDDDDDEEEETEKDGGDNNDSGNEQKEKTAKKVEQNEKKSDDAMSDVTQTSAYKAQKINKLERLTGRRESLSQIQPFLMAETPDEAMKNAQMLRSSDHLKRLYGSRPVFCEKSNHSTKQQQQQRYGRHRTAKSTTATVMATSLSNKLAIITHKQHHTPSTSVTSDSIASSVTSSDVSASPANSGSSDGSCRRRRSSSCGSESDSATACGGGTGAATATVHAGFVVNKRVDKLNKLMGRRDSISEIVELLDPKTPDEARECAKSLYSMEVLKRKLGTRPTSSVVIIPHKGKKAPAKPAGVAAHNDVMRNDVNDDVVDESASPAVGTSCDSGMSATTLSSVLNDPIDAKKNNNSSSSSSSSSSD